MVNNRKIIWNIIGKPKTDLKKFASVVFFEVKKVNSVVWSLDALAKIEIHNK